MCLHGGVKKCRLGITIGARNYAITGCWKRPRRNKNIPQSFTKIKNRINWICKWTVFCLNKVNMCQCIV